MTCDPLYGKSLLERSFFCGPQIFLYVFFIFALADDYDVAVGNSVCLEGKLI